MEGVLILKEADNILQFETCFPIHSPLEYKISHTKGYFFFHVSSFTFVMHIFSLRKFGVILL